MTKKTSFVLFFLALLSLGMILTAFWLLVVKVPGWSRAKAANVLEAIVVEKEFSIELDDVIWTRSANSRRDLQLIYVPSNYVTESGIIDEIAYDGMSISLVEEMLRESAYELPNYLRSPVGEVQGHEIVKRITDGFSIEVYAHPSGGLTFVVGKLERKIAARKSQ